MIGLEKFKILLLHHHRLPATDSGSDFSIPEFDSHSEYDRYFAEVGTKRDSAVTSAGTQVGPTPWMTLGPTQGVPCPSSDPSLVPLQFKKPRTPPPRTVVATTRTEMYLRHTSQDVMVTSLPPDLRHRHASSLFTYTGSRVPATPQTSPRSSVQQWLDALDTQAPPPPTSNIPPSQPVSMYSGVTSSMQLGYSASQMAPQWVRSPCHSQMSHRSRFSITLAKVIQGMMDFSTQMSNNIAHLVEGIRVDAAHREDAMCHESLARDQCHRIEANERDTIQRNETTERERMMKQEAMELRQEAALREEKMRVDVLVREELNLAREKTQAEIKARNKQFKIQANNELQHQKLDAEMNVQLAHMELIEWREIEFQQEKLRKKDVTAKEMEAHLLLDRQLAGEKHKTLRLEYEAKFRRHEIAESQRLAPIPERESSLGVEKSMYRCTSTVQLQCTYAEPGTLL